MTLPEDLTYVTVTGRLADGTNRAVVFRAPSWLVGAPFVSPFAVAAAVQPDGTFSVSLPATDDPAWSPSGWSYEVSIAIDGQLLTGSIEVPVATVGSLALAGIFQPDIPAVPGAASYLLTSARGVAGGVAGLDADGDVVDAAGSKITGGGGGSTSWTSITGKPSTFTPSAHASSHASAGTDPLTLAQSQVSGLSTALTSLGTTDTSLADRITALENAGGGGGGVVPGFASGYKTDGNLAGTNSTGAWEVISGFTMAIPAVVGDRITFNLSALVDHNGSRTDLFDLAVIVGGVPVRCASSNGATPGADGLPEQSNSTVQYGPGSFRMAFTAVSGDISGGNITFAALHKGPGTGGLLAGTAYPLRWDAINLKQ